MKVGIIGAGKVGISMGFLLMKRGVELTGFSSTREDALRLARSFCGESLLYTTDNLEIVGVSEVIAIATQDRNIRSVAESISESFSDLRGKLFFHTSGSHSIAVLSSLKTKGASVGSLHPLQTFPDVESAIRALPETYIFVEGEEESISALTTIGSKIGFKTIPIESEKKVLYHLCAVFVCNLLCALVYAGSQIMERIGTGLLPFMPIIRATIGNIEEKGPVLALTGPIVRGDVETVSAHIEAIKDNPPFLETYKSLSLFALEIAKKRGTLDLNTQNEMENLLKTD
ncbi:MAG: DUF2520 domain-containing protein [Deltaproteobacteria bacterium]|nr:DUF2520 domain-containing protein [Deltaproteobacteria bacterium]